MVSTAILIMNTLATTQAFRVQIYNKKTDIEQENTLKLATRSFHIFYRNYWQYFKGLSYLYTPFLEHIKTS